jgi:hypothetical protein
MDGYLPNYPIAMGLAAGSLLLVARRGRTIGPAAAVALVISFFGLIATVFYVRIQQREGV